MSLKVGIVGLPNVGKSTLFNALLGKQQALAANYPFATIEPNVGIVPVPDDRLTKLAEVVHTSILVPATVEFVDIAGLVKGASQGEGLGNKFLAHIREVDAILFLLRDFSDENVVRAGSADPQMDLEILKMELGLSDYEMVEKHKAKKNADVENLSLLGDKPAIVVYNTDEDKLVGSGLRICAKLEEELASLNEAEVKAYLKELGIEETGLEKVIRTAFDVLGLQTFLTAGEKEVRAWTIKRGMKAPQAAGVIHTDFEKKFIKAKVCDYDDFVKFGGWKGASEAGKIRLEGRDYVMKDGDVVEFMVGS